MKPVSAVLGRSRRRLAGGFVVVASLMPMAALGVHLLGIAPLPLVTAALVAPTFVLTVAILGRDPDLRATWWRGLLAGLVAVTVYDAFRLPLVALGVWEDFIPRIGRWVLGGRQGNWVIGYLWRYVGDGGFMGVTYVVASRGWRASPRARTLGGLGFGSLVWALLMVVAVTRRDAGTGLFPVTPVTVAASLVGHLIYGGVLGWASGRPRRAAVAIAPGDPLVAVAD